MAKLKITQAEQDAQDEKAATVKEVAENVAKDVGETISSDERPKKKAKKHKVAERRTPAQERTAPERKGDPLKGVTIDSNENYPKILHLIVTAGADDERSMDDFISDVRSALTNTKAKNVTVLLQQYQIQGQHILSHHYDAEIAAQNKEVTDA